MQEREKSNLKLSLIIESSSDMSFLIESLHTVDYDLTPDEDGNTALHQLAKTDSYYRMSNEDKREIVELLLELNVDMDAKNAEKRTALYLMIKHHRYDMANILLKYGAKIDFMIEDDDNILQLLAYAKFNYIADLISHRQFEADPFDDIDSILKHFCNVVDINQLDEQKNTLLQRAISQFKFLLSILLTELGIELNNCNEAGFTALEMAAQAGWFDLILLLASKNVAMKRSITFENNIIFHSIEDIFSYAIFDAVQFANEKKLVETINYLLKISKEKQRNGFKDRILNKWNHKGVTALHVATKAGQLALINYLINAGADINTKSSEGIKPLLMITKQRSRARIGDDEILTLFINTKRLDLNDADSKGRTLLHTYCEWNHSGSLIELLLKSGANPNSADKEGTTPLHLAAYTGNIEYVQLLLKNGAKCFITNARGHSPLEYAISGYNSAEESLKSAKNSNLDDELKVYRVVNREKEKNISRKLIELLLNVGAGLYANCSLQMPKDITIDNKLVIGLHINSKPVQRGMKGFERAITNIEELKSAIKQGIEIDRNSFITLCSMRLVDTNEQPNHENLKLLRLILFQLEPKSLINICLNTCNQPTSELLRRQGLHKDSQIPYHLKQLLIPIDDEIEKMKYL